MRKRKIDFDEKFGAEFIGQVPLSPGVYEVTDAEGRTIYVGKAKRLRRRLQQYRNARRAKKHHKMKAILEAAAGLRIYPCPSDLDALLLENGMIQTLRPRFNVAGAFSFLYPVIGLKREGTELTLAYTTTPREFPIFEHYGAFRSRETTREGYFALLEILAYIGHRQPRRKLAQLPHAKFSHVAGFRQIGENWVSLLDRFLRGESPEFLEQAVMALIEKPLARRNAAEIQEMIDGLKRFYKFEARPLRKALAALSMDCQAITQDERDRVFLRSRQA